ncbi:MAG: hypothetical protein ACK41T_13100 [Pseudobdellovibrio sp.]
MRSEAIKQKLKIKNISIPGKTFLVGEYAALLGGPCLGLATSPCFTLKETFLKAENADGEFAHPESAAGLYQAELKEKRLAGCKLNNPYHVGGFGASTAEFIALYLDAEINANAVSAPYDSRLGKINLVEKAFLKYRELYQEKKKEQPSGADLVTQMLGQVTFFDYREGLFKVERLAWPFEELDFLIYSTGLKIKTHEHLRQLDRNMLEPLCNLSLNVIQTFKNKQSSNFLTEMDKWILALEKLNLTHPQIIDLKLVLEKNIQDIKVKPCGALGADVILVLVERSKVQHIRHQIEQLKGISERSDLIKGLKYIADSSHLVDGALDNSLS